MATSNKYDRQLRLWGPQGQRALSTCTVVLFNATAVGTETLKNLILPAVGKFHVVDDAILSKEGDDGGSLHGSNFFVFGNEIGAKRAEVACKHLGELNPDCVGSYEHVPSLASANYGDLLDAQTKVKEKDDDQKHGKVLVIASDLPPKPLLNLSRACYDRGVPLVIVKSYGLVGIVRVQVRDHPIVESKPDNSVPDLRLANPFPGLLSLVESVDLGKMNSKDHKHVPYVVLLVKAMEKWREGLMDVEEESKKKRFPKSLEEKNEFREVVVTMSREFVALEKWRKGDDDADEEGEGGGTEEDGEEGATRQQPQEQEKEEELRFPMTAEEKAEYESVLSKMAGRRFDIEENFEEAERDAYLAYASREIPWELQELLDTAEERPLVGTTETEKGTAKFNVLQLALKKFLEKEGQPPLNGSIPDMFSSTEMFIKLQEIYQAKAAEDISAMRTILDAIQKENSDAPDISDEALSIFCKNVHNIQLLKTRSFADEYEAHTTPSETVTVDEEEIRGDLQMAAMDPYEVPEHTPLLWHIALRACDVFHENHGHYPGKDSRTLALQSDVDEVHRHIGTIVSCMGLSESDLIKSTLLADPDKKHAKEMVRYYNAEIHNVASVIGGAASQECVKLITGQYVPVNDTYVFNGLVGVGGVYRF